ncbi:MAG: hypothetical protein ACR2KK_22215 [Acidimicrobiales bacterium]
MNPPAVVRPESPDRVRRNLGLGAGMVVLGLVAAIALAVVVGRSAGSATVARLRYENPTVYAIDVEVSSGTGTGWTSAGSVRQRSTADVEEVTDQGDVWLFRFNSQGETGGELRLSRSELEASGWRIVIPAEVGTRLVEAGAPPTP